MRNLNADGTPRWSVSNLDAPAYRTWPRPAPAAPAPDASSINDPFIRELVRKREEAPHFAPIPLDATVKDFDLDRLASQQRGVMRAGGAFDMGEADLAAIFQRRQTQQQQPHTQQATLRMGAQVFRPLQQVFGNTLTLARFAGNVDQNTASVPVVVKGEASVYVVQPNQTQVNIQEIQANPRLLTTLVVVQFPSMTSPGPLLVQREALVNGTSYPGGRSMLTDGRAAPAMVGGRTILKG